VGKSLELESMKSFNIIMTIKPHPLAFLWYYMLWIYIMVVSMLFYLYHDRIVEYSSEIPLLGGWVSAYIPLILWSIATIVPLMITSLIKISWRYTFIGVSIGIILPALLWYFKHTWYPYLYYTGTLIAILGIIGVELYRRAHRYIITDRGLIMEFHGLKNIRREILYSRISDLVLEKGVLGKIFNFGNIVPISTSGLGLGEDEVHTGIGVGVGKGIGVGIIVAGSKSVKEARTRSYYMLYGVPNPEKVYEIIAEHIRNTEEAPYLKKILEALKKKE